MKIRVTDLKPEGRQIKDTLSIDKLNARLSQGRTVDIVFIDPPVVELEIVPTINGAQTSGTVRTAYTQECARCLDPVRREVSVPADFCLQRTEPGVEITAEEASAEGVCFFDGDYVDLEELLQENLLLSLSLYWQPERDACGSCVVCKRNPTKQLETAGEPNVTLGHVLKRVLTPKNQN
jgi:uncharacterized metal-binding protein YceD (DUF177 family)